MTKPLFTSNLTARLKQLRGASLLFLLPLLATIGCEKSEEVTPTSTFTASTSSDLNVGLGSEASVSPLVATTTVTITYSVASAGIVYITATDYTGSEVLNSGILTRQPGQYTQVFNVSSLPRGIYAVKMKLPGSVKYLRFQVAR